jgi:hypothetical protein
VKPSVGRIVHYVSYGTPGGEYGKECRAAIVTEAPPPDSEAVGLCVLNPAGQFFNRGVFHDEGSGDSGTGLCGGRAFDGGTWHWPGRAEGRAITEPAPAPGPEIREDAPYPGFKPTSQLIAEAGINPGQPPA